VQKKSESLILVEDYCSALC